MSLGWLIVLAIIVVIAAFLILTYNRLVALAEAYPQLQAVQEFKDLSENLRDTEDKIQFSRRFYNGQVRDYNTALQTFPTVTLAGIFGFKSSEYFEVEEPSDREVPKVS